MRARSPSITTQGSKTSLPSQLSEAERIGEPGLKPRSSRGAARWMARGPKASQKTSPGGCSSGTSGGSSSSGAAA